jgi:hypothetical protein
LGTLHGVVGNSHYALEKKVHPGFPISLEAHFTEQMIILGAVLLEI